MEWTVVKIKPKSIWKTKNWNSEGNSCFIFVIRTRVHRNFSFFYKTVPIVTTLNYRHIFRFSYFFICFTLEVIWMNRVTLIWHIFYSTMRISIIYSIKRFSFFSGFQKAFSPNARVQSCIAFCCMIYICFDFSDCCVKSTWWRMAKHVETPHIIQKKIYKNSSKSMSSTHNGQYHFSWIRHLQQIKVEKKSPHRLLSLIYAIMLQLYWNDFVKTKTPAQTFRIIHRFRLNWANYRI